MKSKTIKQLLSIISVALLLVTLGAAFGILSGRGALVGMLSTCIIALITGLIGGTRYGVSSPTGPMTAAIAVIFVSRSSNVELLSLTLLCTAVILLVFNLLKAHRLVQWVPNLVVSGFVNGIALLIVIAQAKTIETSIDWAILAATFALAMGLRKVQAGSFFVIVFMSLAVFVLDLPTSSVAFSSTSLSDVLQIYLPQFDLPALLAAVPLAFELAVIALLDTLLTGIIMEKESKHPTQYQRELSGQSLAMACIGLVGGIPGAQSTVPSMMLFKEKVKLRHAKLFLALITIAISVFFVGLIQYVPSAVFAGIIFKIAYDVADVTSLKAVFLRAKKEFLPLFILTGTLLSTVFISLNLAVIAFTLLFVCWNFIMPKRWQSKDLVFGKESEGAIDEL